MLWADCVVRRDNKDRVLCFPRSLWVKAWVIPQTSDQYLYVIIYLVLWSIIRNKRITHVIDSLLLLHKLPTEYRVANCLRNPAIHLFSPRTRSQLHKMHCHLEFIISAYRVPRSQHFCSLRSLAVLKQFEGARKAGKCLEGAPLVFALCALAFKLLKLLSYAG